jgi:ribonuclease D
MAIEFNYISSNSELKSLIHSIKSDDVIYIDLEFDKNHFRYGFNLCLIQVKVNEICYLIDPLSELTVEFFFPILENPAITKVCFSFGEDIRLLHYLGCFPKNIIDLAVVRSLLNKPVISLTNLILEELDHKVGDSQQKSNWFLRPLTSKQCEYAAEDVYYLPKIYFKLMDELSLLGRTSWLHEEMSYLTNQDFSNEPVGYQIRSKDRKGFDDIEWTRYKKMVAFREDFAIKLDRPSYKVINTNFLTAIAKNPKLIEEWATNKNIYPSLRKNSVKSQVESLLNEKVEDDVLETEAIKQGVQSKLTYSKKAQRISQWKDPFFVPIRELVKVDIGEHFANFVFSNRKIEAICKGDVELLNYQKELVRSYACQLNLTLPSFL